MKLWGNTYTVIIIVLNYPLLWVLQYVAAKAFRTRNGYFFIFSNGISCLTPKKNYLSPVTGKRNMSTGSKILQFDSKSDFYGFYKSMIYSLEAVRESCAILTRLRKVTLTQLKQMRRICVKSLWTTWEPYLRIERQLPFFSLWKHKWKYHHKMDATTHFLQSAHCWHKIFGHLRAHFSNTILELNGNWIFPIIYFVLFNYKMYPVNWIYTYVSMYIYV